MEVVRNDFSISTARWDEHLEEIASLTIRHEGLHKTDLSIKTMATVSVVGGTASVIAIKNIGTMTTKFASKVSSKLIGKATAKMATKTGSKVAAKMGGKFLGPIIGVAIIIWDVIDHKSTKEKNLPILSSSLYEFLDELKLQLLKDDESSVMWVVDDFVEDYVHALSYEQQAE